MTASKPYEPRSITGRIGAGGKRVVDSIVNLLASLHVHPNILTLIGMFINIFAMILFAQGIFRWAALVIIFAGIFDKTGDKVRRIFRFRDRSIFGLVAAARLNYLVREDQSHFLRWTDGARPDRLGIDQLHARPRRIADSGV